jgi:hypothetical protein
MAAPAVAAAAEEEPEDVESIEDEEEEDFEIVEEPSFGGEVKEIHEVEMVDIPKKASVKTVSSSAVQAVTLLLTMSVIEDQEGFKYVRLEIHLLSGMTKQMIYALLARLALI